MQHLNHDMDELLRRAAEGYPVKPTGADWDKVAEQLEAAETKAPPGPQYGGLKKLLLLLPFVLASFVCDKFFTVKWGTLPTMETAARGHVPDLVTNNEKQAKRANVPVRNYTQKRTGETRKTPQELHMPEPEITESPAITTHKKPLQTMGSLKSLPFAAGNEPTSDFLTVANNSTEPVLQKLQHVIVIGKEKLINPITSPLKKQRDAHTGKGYISLLVGPDISWVKDQRIEATGYSIGLLAGYNFSRKWAVESGVFWDRKNYYSDGEYFKTNKIKLPQGTTVLKVYGYCAMLEIPLNLRYTILAKKNMTFTATAGFSSYIMKKEDYDYVSKNINSTTPYYGNAKRIWESKDWLSVANLSLGYEHQFGPKSKIHIEPYLKLPLRGVGIGSLPLRSAGVLVGITRTIQ
jgi:hypothetical protein